VTDEGLTWDAAAVRDQADRSVGSRFRSLGLMPSRKKSQKPVVRVVVVDSDPLRLIGFRTLLKSERDFDLIYASSPNVKHVDDIDVILLGNRRDRDSFDDVARLRASCPRMKIIAVGSGMREESILAALASGAKGYVDESATAAEFIRAVRAVSQGSLWISRRVISMFVERAASLVGRTLNPDRKAFTVREIEVLEMLVEGRSNRDIAQPLGIEVRTVKAHLGKLMRKTGVQSRIALSSYAITHSLVSSGQDCAEPA
jgi:DNA-binding NarL/FixJ family response regulator